MKRCYRPALDESKPCSPSSDWLSLRLRSAPAGSASQFRAILIFHTARLCRNGTPPEAQELLQASFCLVKYGPRLNDPPTLPAAACPGPLAHFGLGQVARSGGIAPAE